MKKSSKALFLSLLLVSVLGRLGLAQEAKPRTAPPSDGMAAAVVDGKTIVMAELDASAQGKLIALTTQEYELKRQALDDLIDQRLLEKEAARRGLTVEQLVRDEVENKLPDISEEQLKGSYEITKDRYGDKPEAEVKKQIAASLRQTHVSRRRSEFLKELRGTADIQVLLAPPRIKVNAEDTRAKGPQGAPVTIVEFAEFQCPYCRVTAATVRQLAEKYKGKVRIVFRDFPIDGHPYAAKAAEAASCANDQGKFWEMHDKLFQNQANLKPEELKEYATEIGLNIGQFNGCLESGKYSGKWQSDRAQGTRYGVTGTPTFFINGRMLAGAASLTYFSNVVEEELARAGASTGAVSMTRTAQPKR